MSYHHLLLQRIESALVKRKEAERKTPKIEVPNFKEISDAIDTFHIYHKLKVYSGFLSAYYIFGEESNSCTKEDLLFIEEIMCLLDSQYIERVEPPICIYYLICKIFQQLDSTKDIGIVTMVNKALKVLEGQNLLSVEEELEAYSLLNNVCIKKMNKDYTKAVFKEKFVWINNKLLNINAKGLRENKIQIQPRLFRNIVSTALNISNDSFFTSLSSYGFRASNPSGKFINGNDWIINFITYYKEKLNDSNPKVNEVYTSYCLAKLAFKKKNFEEAYRILNNPARVQGTFVNLFLKVLHLKILYEINKDKDDLLEYDKIEVKKVFEAYKKLVKFEEEKKQQLSYQLPYYSDFAILFGKLFNFFFKYNGKYGNASNPLFLKKKAELDEQIHNTKHSYKDWLLEKLHDIK
ncbi:MAG: hypothetical protein MI974_29935 [Chitinophagales bacterium]|nr:hypothetical protein [Chitinophagales bacterium]